MTRKDSEKDSERPHYYSQFWLDIAAGRRVIGGPKPEDGEASEPETLEPALARKTGRSNSSVYDGYKESPVSARVDPAEEEEEQDDLIDEAEMPNIAVDEDEDPVAAQDVEQPEEDVVDDESEEDGFYDDEEEEEEEEDWDRRGGGRKKTKAVRPTKLNKKLKRDPRRTF